MGQKWLSSSHLHVNLMPVLMRIISNMLLFIRIFLFHLHTSRYCRVIKLNLVMYVHFIYYFSLNYSILWLFWSYTYIINYSNTKFCKSFVRVYSVFNYVTVFYHSMNIFKKWLYIVKCTYPHLHTIKILGRHVLSINRLVDHKLRKLTFVHPT